MIKVPEMKINQVENSAQKLFNNVVNGGYCIGCGACASLESSPFQIRLDEFGRYQAKLDPAADVNKLQIPVGAVCPFSEQSLNEDQLGERLFSQHGVYDKKLGYTIATYAGYVSEGEFRKKGSSGGMGTWLACELLSEGLVDGIVHVHPHTPSDEDSSLFQYQISSTLEQVRAGAKSRYYPVEMSEAVRHIRQNEGVYAVIGIPCFIKAIRLLTLQDPVLAKRIKFCIGLVCGQLPTTRFADSFAWQAGIKPGNLLTIDFRKKLNGAPASKFGVSVTGKKDGEIIEKTVPFGFSWGRGFFKYNACDYCDDIVGETADISIGDAWLPKYVNDSRGASVVVVRNSKLNELIEQGIKNGRLSLDKVNAKDVVASQSSGFRHRRDGLAYRLHLADKEGKWHPPKRVKPNDYKFNLLFRKTHEMRMKLAKESHLAFKEARDSNDLSIFWKRMNPFVRRYQMVQAIPFIRKKLTTIIAKKRENGHNPSPTSSHRKTNLTRTKFDTPRSITVINHVDSLNLGDASLMYMTVKILEQAFDLDEINVLSFDITNDENLINVLGDVRVHFISSPARTSKSDTAAVIKEMIHVLLWSIIYRLTRKDLSFLSRNKVAISALKSADMIIIRGGDNLADTYGSASLLKHLYNICLGIILGTKMVVLGTTIGPFSKTISKWLAFWILKKVNTIIARDRKSVQLLHDGGIGNHQIHFIPDVAFDLPTQVDENYTPVSNSHQEKLVGLASSALMSRFLRKDRYTTYMAEICDSIIDKYHSKIVLIPHVLTGSFSDLSAAEAIHEKMRNKHFATILCESNPMKVKYVISKLELLISARMHPIIHALSQGIPVIGIDYNEKTRELMKFMNKEDWVIDFDSIHMLKEKIDSFFTLRGENNEFYRLKKVTVLDDYVKLLQQVAGTSKNQSANSELSERPLQESW